MKTELVETMVFYIFVLLSFLIVAFGILKINDQKRNYAEKCYEQTQYLGCWNFDALSSMQSPAKQRK